MEKIPTPLIVGGGAVLALLVVSKMAGGAGASIRTLGPVPSAGVDQQAIAADQNKTQGFATLVSAVTSLDMAALQASSALSLEQLRSSTLISINDAQNQAQATRDKLSAQIASQQSANQLAAQRSADKTGFWSGVINMGIGLLSHLF